MNERLTDLAIKAKVEHCISHVRLQEFAELIVRECVQTMINNTPERYASEDDWDRGYGRAMEDCIHHIREHFGVEE